MAPGRRAADSRRARAAAPLPRRPWPRRMRRALAVAASGCALLGGASWAPSAFSYAWRSGGDGALGVYATERIGRGEVVERCYCVPVEAGSVAGHWLEPWLFDRGPGRGELLFPLGFGCLYNEVPPGGDSANLRWEYQEVRDASGVLRPYLVLIAFAIIPAGQELCVKRRRTGEHGSLRDVLGSSLRSLDAGGDAAAPFRPPAGRGDFRLDPPSGVAVASSPLHGNGVFATRPFREGETVEVVPSLTISCLGQACRIFRDYELPGSHPNASRVALGHGSVYNHRGEPNVLRCAVDAGPGAADALRGACYRYYAARDIDAGEELVGRILWRRLAPEVRLAIEALRGGAARVLKEERQIFR
ncbi:unnamed protein product [Prorocentrum cordatum]|uniref:SET domain-containing protein n=1 Tax=Prorocentrum cordatum TaxID=2364126 RepID=A0ABN9UT02_9DINO|nr:unnamed protein product [Polarella glacialis]